MRLKSLSLAIAALAASASVASANTVDNTSLAAPGVYYGTGNSNSGYTVTTEGSIELGLSAIERYIGPITPTGNTYDVATGETTVSGKTGSTWDFTFSVNENVDGHGTLNLGDTNAILSMTDVGNGTSGSFNLGLIFDNTEYGSSGACSPAFLCGSASSYYGFQNSESLSFPILAGLLGDSGFNENANDTYDFGLTLTDANNNVLATDAIKVVAGTGATPVPEPITMSLFGTGLVGAFAMRRRRKAAKA